jgi:3-hydroxy-9,10-secoandrosta-1,3,5(10)-triene-9,17-dione monooxygenase
MSSTKTAARTTASDFHDVTPEALVARAEAMAPQLVELQGETEGRTFYSAETHREFAAAGFYRILAPKRYGGLELGIDTFLRVASALARGCGSTGWMFCLGTSHALTVASFFEEQVQEEVFAEADLVIPATVRPQGSFAKVDDGWTINGDFNFCSGAPYSTWFMSHTLPPGANGPMLFVAPRSQYTRLDDWGAQIGLKGSGSHSLRFENAYIPDRYTMPDTALFTMDISGETIGQRLHGNPMYGGSSYSFFMLEPASLSIGIAKGALDAYEELMRTKQTPIPPFAPRTHDQNYQRWHGTALGMVAAAEAAWLSCMQQWMDLAERDAFTPENDMRLVTISKEIIRMCWAAVVDNLVRSAGSTSMRAGERIERVHRDLSTIHSHNALVAFAEAATINVSKARNGVQ